MDIANTSVIIGERGSELHFSDKNYSGLDIIVSSGDCDEIASCFKRGVELPDRFKQGKVFKVTNGAQEHQRAAACKDVRTQLVALGARIDIVVEPLLASDEAAYTAASVSDKMLRDHGLAQLCSSEKTAWCIGGQSTVHTYLTGKDRQPLLHAAYAVPVAHSDQVEPVANALATFILDARAQNVPIVFTGTFACTAKLPFNDCNVQLTLETLSAYMSADSDKRMTDSAALMRATIAQKSSQNLRLAVLGFCVVLALGCSFFYFFA